MVAGLLGAATLPAQRHVVVELHLGQELALIQGHPMEGDNVQEMQDKPLPATPNHVQHQVCV